ncbi:ATP-dependent DNA ligase [Wenzhouxiangella marina]|uniref:DNA ligase (ATP) n=1 Tax=Wenzhouxiangella marina TaxID=1579979 RepID=A0A0K0XUM9_9GAMM|nr:ATP-dependent DNA ligase [Wenzhouxiangella marina]AKS41388.1 ATP-dependent DNA ligase [Wenzhouxiangella marina]MBB6086858.1 DNA ligase-1 [Wenzhouxiangella marina]
MKRFARLFEQLDRTTATQAKVAHLVDYFREAPAADAAWAVHFLTGRRLKRLVKTSELRAWTAEASGLDDWLVEESYQHVGDLAETMHLLLPPAADRGEAPALSDLVEDSIKPLASMETEQRKEAVRTLWRQFDGTERFMLNKLLTGGFRVGVSKRLVTRALAELAGVDSSLVAHRLMGRWQASAEFFERLIAGASDRDFDRSTPYPFFLASPLTEEPAALGPPEDWQAEWKWDGIRAQLIRREARTFIWSRGEERMDGRFPELEAAAEALPDGTVLDGEIMAWRDGQPLPFNVLQTRIGRKKPGKTTLAKAPVALLVYDCLEADGKDLRERDLAERLTALDGILADVASPLLRSEAVDFEHWDALPELQASARERGVEGLMLKRLNSPYRVGRKRGDWWKWKVEPYTFDGVLLYAQPGHGRRSNLFTDYTFAVHHGDELVPVAKAYSGLTQKEIDRLDRWIRANTRERFGPVRSVEPVQVFELAFEGISPSPRHKSGIALRFPRIHRWREDLSVEQADRLDDLKRLLPDPASS